MIPLSCARERILKCCTFTLIRRMGVVVRDNYLGRSTAAAAKVGISVRSARRLEQCTRLPSQRGLRRWRTCADPLAEVWDSQIKPLLQAAPG